MGLALVATLPLLLAADPSVSVTLGRRTSVGAADAAAVTGVVWKSLDAAAVPVLPAAETTQRLARVRQKDATRCNGKPACLKELLKALDVPWLVLVSVAQVAGDKSLSMELLDAASGTVVEVESLVLPSWKDVKPELLEPYATRVLARVAPPPPVVATKPADAKPGDGKPADGKPADGTPGDAPLATTLTPKDPPPPALPPEVPAKSHAASWVLGGVGLAALAAAGVMLGLGLSSHASLSQGVAQPDGTVQSDLTGAQAQARASTATLQLGIAGGAAAAALGLGTAAILTW